MVFFFSFAVGSSLLWVATGKQLEIHSESHLIAANAVLNEFI